MKYRVLASLRDELNQGWVWVTNSGFDSRSVVKITNKKNNKSVYCECLEIDDNYIFVYNNPSREHIKKNDPTLIVSEWYRKRLGGIHTKTDHDLDIRAANGWFGKLCANLQHPQAIVRMATCLAIISVALGIISVVLAILSIK